MVFPSKNDETQGTTTPPESTSQTAGNITKEDLEALEKRLSEKMTNWYRGIQSQADTIETRVRKKIDEYEKIAAQQGMKIPDNVKEQLTNEETIKELRASQSASSPDELDPMQQPGESDQDFANRINNEALKLMKESNTTIEDNDPEVAIINKVIEDGGTAQDYLNAHKQAIEAKKSRIAAKPPVSIAGSVPSAITGSTSPNPISNVTNRDELWDLAHKNK